MRIIERYTYRVIHHLPTAWLPNGTHWLREYHTERAVKTLPQYGDEQADLIIQNNAKGEFTTPNETRRKEMSKILSEAKLKQQATIRGTLIDRLLCCVVVIMQYV